VTNYKGRTRHNRGDFREGFAELIKRKILSTKPIPIPDICVKNLMGLEALEPSLQFLEEQLA
jgi:hypothetical protein